MSGLVESSCVVESSILGKLSCVVVAVDGSEESMNALKWALDNLKLKSQEDDSEPGTYVILHVQSPPTIAAGLNPGAIPFGGPTNLEVPAFTQAIEAHQRRITEAVLAHALKICSETKVSVKTQVVVGDSKEMICEVVKNLHADLLVMGSRSFGPIKRMFLGSVSNYCTNHAQCSVIVVKGSSAVS
ncbi:universal stress protein PHOS32 [Macadamia integrifolia]|uniref:universal stress protein PHOS32 n=1 Tax=Macadamia integrifolia TaxID=60698 RepID=UPI001C4F5481|nr:universal stress protein PHOS32 [Macadamia integrifolia]XP_042496678.1 universal stress protein PHOS32 [Macadamia integrifolia]XP_042496679.1 universal stress protein PHOS32 [Macadamia integrifolia]